MRSGGISSIIIIEANSLATHVGSRSEGCEEPECIDPERWDAAGCGDTPDDDPEWAEFDVCENAGEDMVRVEVRCAL